MRNDKEVVMQAVSKKGIIVKYASYKLRCDKDIAIAALKQNKKSYEFFSEEIKQDEQIKEMLN